MTALAQMEPEQASWPRSLIDGVHLGAADPEAEPYRSPAGRHGRLNEDLSPEGVGMNAQVVLVCRPDVFGQAPGLGVGPRLVIVPPERGRR